MKGVEFLVASLAELCHSGLVLPLVSLLPQRKYPEFESQGGNRCGPQSEGDHGAHRGVFVRWDDGVVGLGDQLAGSGGGHSLDGKNYFVLSLDCVVDRKAHRERKVEPTRIHWVGGDLIQPRAFDQIFPLALHMGHA